MILKRLSKLKEGESVFLNYNSHCRKIPLCVENRGDDDGDINRRLYGTRQTKEKRIKIRIRIRTNPN